MSNSSIMTYDTIWIADLISDNDAIFDFTPIYCLKSDQLLQARNPKGIMGALFICPHCGQIRAGLTDYHIFNPSQPLIDRLKSSSAQTPMQCEDIFDPMLEVQLD